MARPNILDRFRPAGAPGPAGPVGVPPSDTTGPAAELGPVFTALAADVSACDELVTDAQARADATIARARERAGALVAQARLDAAGVRADAAARVVDRAAKADADLTAQSLGDAETLQQAGTRRLPATVRNVIDRLLADHVGQS